MIAETRSAAWPSRDRVAALEPEPLGGGAADGDLAVAGARAGQLERARERPGGSAPVSSTSADSPLAATTMPRVATFFDERPSASIAARSAALASRWATVSTRSPPISARPSAAMARSIDEARLVTDDSPAIAMARHSHSRPSPPSPPFRSRRARLSAALTRSARHRPCARCARRAPRPPDHG